jgi:hypothetical protein
MFLSLPFFITAYIVIEQFVRVHYGIPKPNSAYITALPALAIGLLTSWGIVQLQERRRARKMKREQP